MTVSARCEEAKFLIENQMYNAALILLLLAVSAASESYRKRENPDCLKKGRGDDRKYFAQYLINRDDRFKEEVQFEGKSFTIAELIYQHLRCELVHEAQMSKTDLGVSFDLISIKDGKIFVGFGTLGALIDVLTEDSENDAQSSFMPAFSGNSNYAGDFPTRVKNVNELEDEIRALKNEFGLTDGRISILEQVVVRTGPNFLINSTKDQILKRVNGEWRKVMQWAGMNLGAETGLRMTKYPIVSGGLDKELPLKLTGDHGFEIPQTFDDAPLEVTDHGVAVLKRLAKHYVSKY